MFLQSSQCFSQGFIQWVLVSCENPDISWKGRKKTGEIISVIIVNFLICQYFMMMSIKLSITFDRHRSEAKWSMLDRSLSNHDRLGSIIFFTLDWFRAVDRPGHSGLCPGWGAQLPWVAKIRKKTDVFCSQGIIQVWLGKNCHERFYCWKRSGMTWGTPE